MNASKASSSASVTFTTRAARTVLVCDDDDDHRALIRATLEASGHTVVEAQNGEQALELTLKGVDVLLLDLQMPGMSGLDTLRQLRRRGDTTPTLVMTAFSAIDSAIEATGLGASHYLTKPFPMDQLDGLLTRVIADVRRAAELEVHRQHSFAELVGDAPAMRAVVNQLRDLANVRVGAVLVVGESGTGKDVVARALHKNGPRKDAPFMEVDCAALTETLFESTFFGHERGAFTDAVAQKMGLCEVAATGTLFLDEIGELPPSTQAKLLRTLENRRFKRLGGTRDIELDAAIVAATNRDLRAEVAAGRFRADLFFRLNVVEIRVPALRERPSDIGLLADFFRARFAKELGRGNVTGFTDDALAALERYRWPGNVRELRNVIERALILHGRTEKLDVDALPPEIRFSHLSQTASPSSSSSASASASQSSPYDLPEGGIDLVRLEKEMVKQALDRAAGSISKAASLLGLSRHALRYRAERDGLVIKK